MDYNWEDGAKSLKYIIDIGRQIGERKVDSVLSGNRASPMDSEAAELGELLYGRDEPHAQEETWAEAVRKQEKGVTRLVNSLPQDWGGSPRIKAVPHLFCSVLLLIINDTEGFTYVLYHIQ